MDYQCFLTGFCHSTVENFDVTLYFFFFLLFQPPPPPPKALFSCSPLRSWWTIGTPSVQGAIPAISATAPPIQEILTQCTHMELSDKNNITSPLPDLCDSSHRPSHSRPTSHTPPASSPALRSPSRPRSWSRDLCQQGGQGHPPNTPEPEGQPSEPATAPSADRGNGEKMQIVTIIKGPVINWGVINGKIIGPKLFVRPFKAGQNFSPQFFKGWKPFVPPPSVWLKLKASELKLPQHFLCPLRHGYNFFHSPPHFCRGQTRLAPPPANIL